MTGQPIPLRGPWKAGWALDVHVVASDFIGYDPFGNPQFDSKRSELGEHLYQLKYRSDRQRVPTLCDAVVAFVRKQNLVVDLVVALPPSNESRPFQPLAEIAKAVAAVLGAPFAPDAVRKTKRTEQLKDVKDFAERAKLLAGVFQADPGTINGKRVLLLDDLYRSGATLTAVAQEIVKGGSSASLHVIALTKTGKRR
jgi:competence protein ComFC